MANAHLAILRAAVVRVVHDEGLIGNLGELAAFATDQRHGVQSVRLGPLNGFHKIRRVTADAHRKYEVAGARVVLQLAQINILVAVVVAQRGHPAHVVVEGEDAKAFAEFVRSAFAQVRGEVRGVGGAAAVAENENLAVLLVRDAECLDERGDLFDGDGVERGLLFGDVIGDPAIHVRDVNGGCRSCHPTFLLFASAGNALNTRQIYGRKTRGRTQDAG